MSSIREIVKANRSYRRFHEDHVISKEELVGLVELARFSASGMNNQPLKFLLSCTKETNDIIFPKLAWAGNLPDWPGPAPGERPSAYIILLGDTNISTNYFVDHGIMAQSMLLGAVEKGLGGCMLLSINKPELRSDLDLPEHLKIVLVVALGKPAEEVVTEDVVDGKTGYYRDEDDVHHVPKRTLDELIYQP